MEILLPGWGLRTRRGVTQCCSGLLYIKPLEVVMKLVLKLVVVEKQVMTQLEVVVEEVPGGEYRRVSGVGCEGVWRWRAACVWRIRGSVLAVVHR